MMMRFTLQGFRLLRRAWLRHLVFAVTMSACATLPNALHSGPPATLRYDARLELCDEWLPGDGHDAIRRPAWRCRKRPRILEAAAWGTIGHEWSHPAVN
jgi:hypothetical protein